MALSEQERKLLEQLEASLVADDPKLAETLRGTGEIRTQRRRATLAGLGFLVGVVVLVLGMQLHPAVSVLGFVLMLGSAIIGVHSWQAAAAQDRAARPKPQNHTADFMNKLSERWQQRQDPDQGENNR